MLPKNCAIEFLLKVCPQELRPQIEALLRHIKLTDPDDPVVHLMIGLSLYATYYNTIPDKILATGKTIDTQAHENLAALDVRVQNLRQIAIAFQTVTDRLNSVPQEIVHRFPSDRIVDELMLKVNEMLKKAKITGIKDVLTDLQTDIANVATSAQTIKEHSRQIQEAAQEIASPKAFLAKSLQGLLALTCLGLVVLLIVQGATLFSLKNYLHTQGFIGERTVTGTYYGEPVLIIDKNQLDGEPLHDSNGNWELRFKKDTPSQ